MNSRSQREGSRLATRRFWINTRICKLAYLLSDHFESAIDIIVDFLSDRFRYNVGVLLSSTSLAGDTMTHVSLDAQDEKVRQFVLGLILDPSGSVLESDQR